MQHFPALQRDHFPWSSKNFGMSTKADVVLGRQDHVERDHRRERRAQVLLDAIRDTQQDDGSVGGFVSKKLSSRFVEIHAAAVEEESYPEMG